MSSSLASPPANSDRSAIKATPHLGCLLLCDLANSTRLIEQLGDSRAAQLMRRHDQLARETLHRFHGQEIDKTDGFLVLFDRPVEAVAFALEYQTLLRKLAQEVAYPLAARVGIHVGEILSWRNEAEDIAQGAKPIEIEGLAKAIAARLMGLAQSGQILLSESAYSLAFRAREELPEHAGLRWISHGEYRLHGVSRRMSVFEVGRPELAPLAAPKSKAKAKRIVPWWHWKPLYAGLFSAVAALLIYIMLQPEPAIAFAERDWIVVASLNNRTEDVRLNDSLDVAVRVGLEQSRHVNLVSTMKVRDTLRLMSQPPGKAVDRELASRIAQRVSARAVLLPSVAEVGGRLRFTAELIDPRTETTVYSHSGEARSEDQLLPAIDKVLVKVRSDLGESLRSVEASSLALAQITTSNMDALRAYSLGKKALNESRLEDAEVLYRQALSIDPECHSATLGLAAIALTRERTEPALVLLRSVDTERVPPRDKLYIEAMLTWLEGTLDDAVRRWRLYSEMYPDEIRAAANHAHSLFEAQRYAESLSVHRSTLTQQNSLLSASYSSAAASALAISDFTQAESLLRLALENGNTGRYTIFMLLPLMQQRSDQVNSTLQRWETQGFESSQRRVLHGRVMVALKQDDWERARNLVNQATLPPSDTQGSRDWQLLKLVINGLSTEDANHVLAMQTFLDQGLSELGQGALKLRVEAAIESLTLGLLAIRTGHPTIALGAIDGVHRDGQVQAHPVVAQLLLALQAEIDINQGGDGADLLQAEFEHQPAFQVQASRLHIASLQGKPAEAARAWAWMQANQGGAVSESGSRSSQIAFNLMEFGRAPLLVRLADHSAPHAVDAELAQRWALAASGNFGPHIARRIQSVPPAQ